MSQVEDRWSTFIARFELMGELNPDYVWETDEYLKKLQVTPCSQFLNPTNDALLVA